MVDAVVRDANSRTSSATTAKPRPCSPARAASIAAFNDFHANALSPVYTTGAASGFEVTYRDGLGNVWVSQQGSPNPQVVLFSNIKQESDATGDYSKFQCNFSCYVYRQEPITLVWDSLPIQNAIFKGWFKR